MSISDARKLENLLKRQKGGDGFYRMTGLKCSSGSYSRVRDHLCSTELFTTTLANVV